MRHIGPSISRRLVLGVTLATPFIRRAAAATEVNAYSIWPENYAQPVMNAFEQAAASTSIRPLLLRLRRWRA